MSFPLKKLGKQGTWGSALFLFFAPLFIIFFLRWIFIEPFVIPSKSMMPNLLVHDHILVLKYSYGIKVPFGDGWIFKIKRPQRGDIVVFRYPENRDIFFIKRLIGLPGDHIKVENGQIILNDEPWTIQRMEENTSRVIDKDEENKFNYFTETIPTDQADNFTQNNNQSIHLVRLFSNQEHANSTTNDFTVPPNSYFVMGDNRDQSHDSRYWGYVDEKYLIGRAAYIWLSCEDTLLMAPMICDPLKLRFERIFKKVEDL